MHFPGDFMREGFKRADRRQRIQNAPPYHGQNLAWYRSQTALGVEHYVHAGETTRIEIMSPARSARPMRCAPSLCQGIWRDACPTAATLAHTPVQAALAKSSRVCRAHLHCGLATTGWLLTSAENAAGVQSAWICFVLGRWVAARRCAARNWPSASSAYADYTINAQR